MGANGQLTTPESDFDIIRYINSLKGKGKAVCLGPHADDFVLGMGGYGIGLVEAGWEVYDLVLAAGHRGVTDEWIQSHHGDALQVYPEGSKQRDLVKKFLKERERMSELGLSDALLGVQTRLLGLGFYDKPYDQPNSEAFYRDCKAVESFILAKIGIPDLILYPLDGDKHPNHITTRLIGMEIAPQFAAMNGPEGSIAIDEFASPWYTGPTASNAVFYYREDPKYRLPLLFRSRAIADAEVFRELTGAFGAKPVDMEYYCGLGTALAEPLIIRTAAELKLSALK
jgi:LmbE family N-acetylglucosaminyl deacetylase